MSSPESAASVTHTFLFTDIEGSTRLIQALGERYARLLEQHRALIAAAVEASGGRVFGTEGDALFSAFPSAVAALAAAAQAQQALAAQEWPPEGEVRVRMGIHSGEVTQVDDDFVGLALHEVARISAAGHGGQVLVSEATRRLAGALPVGLELRDLGEHRFKDLAAPERIYQLYGEGLDERFPALRTLDVRLNNLPVQVTSFIGRAELAAARDALSETRLLSLTGPGGTGKTRLALQLAAEVSDEFADGVFFVPLDATEDADLVAPAIATALGLTLSGAASSLDTAAAYLGQRQLLLVLDNFEQVVDAAGVVGRLLRDAPRIKILVTTRIVLRVYGEREFPVPSLGLPPEDAVVTTAEEAGRYEAVQLFADRARAVQPQFVLTDENAPLVVDIVRRLDGLPLAIELAAARTRALPVAAIHARLDQHLALLTGGSRDLPGRQQTLRGAIDWSYDLLEEPDRRLFERFSVHCGGANLSEADAVCGPRQEIGEEVLDGLTSLAEKSLVRPDLSSAADPRYSMLTTIRDYAHERLESRDDFAVLARRHALTYLELAERLEPELTGTDGRRHADRLEQDHDNLRSALDWSLANGETALAVRLIGAMWRFWQVRGHLVEARRYVDAVAAMPGLANQPAAVRARGYGTAGNIAYWQADVPAAHDYYGRALAAARETGDDPLVAEALYNFGFAAIEQPRMNSELYAAGEKPFSEALEIYRRLDDPKGIADTSWGISMSRAANGDLATAIEYGKEALQGYRRIEDPFRVGWGLYLLAGFTAHLGDLATAEPYLRESLETFSRVDDRAGILMTMVGFHMFAANRNQKKRANRLGGAAESLRVATGAALVDMPIELVDFVAPSRPVDDPDALSEWTAGARMTAAEAAAYALADVDADDMADGDVDDKPEISAS